MLIVLAGVGLAWLGRDWIMAKVYMVILEDEGRIRSLQVDRIIRELGIDEGVDVADIGAGTGVLARPFARAVSPSGTVFAVDVNANLVDHLRESAKRLKLKNLQVVEGAYDDPLLPSKVDVIVILDTLHHIENAGDYVAKLPGYLRPGGRLAIIDFPGQDSPHWSASMRIDAAQVEEWAVQAGLTKTGDYDFIRGNFFLVFTLREASVVRLPSSVFRLE